MHKIRIVLFLSGIIIWHSITAQGSAILNGGFEDGPTGINPATPNWTFSQGSPDIIPPGGLNRNLIDSVDIFLAQGMGASPNGGQFALLSNIEAISQTFSGLTIGETYELSFYQGNGGLVDNRLNRSDVTGAGFWDITFGGAGTQPSPTLTHDGFGSQTWSQVTMNFIAANTSESILFDSQVSTGAAARMAIDGVALSGPGLVPEPSTYALFAAAIVGLSIAHRKRKTRQ